MKFKINPFPGTKVGEDVQVKGIPKPFKRNGRAVGTIVGYEIVDDNLILILETNDAEVIRDLAVGWDGITGTECGTLPAPEGSTEPTG